MVWPVRPLRSKHQAGWVRFPGFRVAGSWLGAACSRSFPPTLPGTTQAPSPRGPPFLRGFSIQQALGVPEALPFHPKHRRLRITGLRATPPSHPSLLGALPLGRCRGPGTWTQGPKGPPGSGRVQPAPGQAPHVDGTFPGTPKPVRASASLLTPRSHTPGSGRGDRVEVGTSTLRQQDTP